MIDFGLGKLRLCSAVAACAGLIRNIWIAEPFRGAKARQITPYTEDDGFDIGELAWSHEQHESS